MLEPRTFRVMPIEHWVSMRFDEGDLVDVRRFLVAADETAPSLERRTLRVLVDLCDDFVQTSMADGDIPARPQGPRHSATRHEMVAAAAVTDSDDAPTVERKVRVCWSPPFSRATVEIHGVKHTLVNDAILDKLGRYLHGSRTDFV